MLVHEGQLVMLRDSDIAQEWKTQSQQLAKLLQQDKGKSQI